MTPWSGYFEAGNLGSAGSSSGNNGAAIWTHAHTGQFVKVGWKYLDVNHGSGYLTNGGSYVTLVSPDSAYFSIIIEKLEGRCLRCAGQNTIDELASFLLSGDLKASELQIWSTNETHHFQYLGNITITSDGEFEVFVPRDTIITVSNFFNGQKKGEISAPIPSNTPFPTSYEDDFENYTIDSSARYFADNGGSFQIAASPLSDGGKVVKQWVKNENGVNRWGYNVNPISLIGNSSWTTFTVKVSVLVEGNQAVGNNSKFVLQPSQDLIANSINFQNVHSNECLGTVRPWNFYRADLQVDTRKCASVEKDAYIYDAKTGHWKHEASKKCVWKCSAGIGLCLVKCKLETAWHWNTDLTLRPHGNPGMCLQTAVEILDANLFVGKCNTPPTDQQRWKNALIPAGPQFCNKKKGDYCPGCGTEDCCKSYFVYGKDQSTTYNCEWLNSSSCLQSTKPCTSDIRPHAGLCVRTDRDGNGDCLLVYGNGAWTLGSASGNLSADPTLNWTHLEIIATASNLTAIVNGIAYPATPDRKQKIIRSGPESGMVSINSGYNVAYFDNFSLVAS
eukprot:UC4_evm2s747